MPRETVTKERPNRHDQRLQQAGDTVVGLREWNTQEFRVFFGDTARVAQGYRVRLGSRPDGFQLTVISDKGRTEIYPYPDPSMPIDSPVGQISHDRRFKIVHYPDNTSSRPTTQFLVQDNTGKWEIEGKIGGFHPHEKPPFEEAVVGLTAVSKAHERFERMQSHLDRDLQSLGAIVEQMPKWENTDSFKGHENQGVFQVHTQTNALVLQYISTEKFSLVHDTVSTSATGEEKIKRRVLVVSKHEGKWKILPEAQSLILNPTVSERSEMTQQALKMVSRENQHKLTEEQETLIKGYTESVRAYVANRGERHPEDLARIIVDVAYRGLALSEAGKQLLQAKIFILPTTFFRYVKLAPAIEIGQKHHTLWRKQTGYPDRWRPVNNALKADRRWVDQMKRYFAKYGKYPKGVRSGKTLNDPFEVDLVQNSFAELPPSRQDESIASALIAIRSIKRELEAGRYEQLVEYGKVLGAVIEGADFNLLNVPDVQGVHVLGNENHEEWLTRNEANWNYLTKQNYYDILRVANGQYDQINLDVLKEIFDGAVQDENIKKKVQERQNANDSTLENRYMSIVGQVLQEYAREVILQTLQDGVVILTENGQQMVVEDLKFILFAIQHAEELNQLLGARR